MTLLSRSSESKKLYLSHLLPSIVKVSDICNISLFAISLFPRVS
uniref:Uncharacterized protein n=1 Tax=virus sp. ctrcb4 TaxID=2825824 RepID=A0A8S5RPQ5_9VIRU|nr:MAG TPA: hypothetical protein [virus sp. ctrcb4]DAR12752.1 MAG TPA: hypothetical protein [Crassvirales sp.]